MGGKVIGKLNCRLLIVGILASSLLLLLVFLRQPNRNNSSPEVSMPRTVNDELRSTFPSKRAHDLERNLPWLEDDRARDLVDESDAILDALEEQGITNSDRFLRHELQRIEVTEADMRLYYEEEREHFGDRSFEESVEVLVRLAKYRKLREQYETDPL